ncbi:MAG TPA: hypothetical protein VES68_02485 [Candidatus Sulfotelmatobacter sp.]|nr:hypothetical protein [Candidatus Sulfotelmatobacter sp.]
MKEIKKRAFLNALATAAYIIAVGSFMFWGGSNKIGQGTTFLIPITFLLLFVFSASITSFLIFGKPAQMYVDGKKKEALTLLSYTLLFFSIITFFSILLLVFFGR